MSAGAAAPDRPAVAAHNNTALLAALASVDRLLQHAALQGLQTTHGKTACTQAVRDVLAGLRSAVRAEGVDFDAVRLAPDAIAQAVQAVLAQLEAHGMTALGEGRDITLAQSRAILEAAL